MELYHLRIDPEAAAGFGEAPEPWLDTLKARGFVDDWHLYCLRSAAPESARTTDWVLEITARDRMRLLKAARVLGNTGNASAGRVSTWVSQMVSPKTNRACA